MQLLAAYLLTVAPAPVQDPAVVAELKAVEARRAEGLERRLVDVVRDDACTITVDGRSYLNFSSNDYLGLATHSELIARARDWATRYGAGSAASRLVTGNLDIFTGIEAKIAALKGSEAALIMASGFQANGAMLQALLDRGFRFDFPDLEPALRDILD